MKDYIEYHPNKQLKYKIIFYPNGNIMFEFFYDMNRRFHGTVQRWNINGCINFKNYFMHGEQHNINGPASFSYTAYKKIEYYKPITFFDAY
jgi:antitoxin component YwqK of YwqJK toxin-antitoxin module